MHPNNCLLACDDESCTCTPKRHELIAKPAEVGLPVVGYIYGGNRLYPADMKNADQECAVTYLDQATAEIAKRDAEIAWQKQLIEKMEHAAKHDAAELTTLRAQMEGVVGALRKADYCIRFYEHGGSSYRKEAVDTLQVIAEALATYQSTQGDKN